MRTTSPARLSRSTSGRKRAGFVLELLEEDALARDLRRGSGDPPSTTRRARPDTKRRGAAAGSRARRARSTCRRTGRRSRSRCRGVSTCASSSGSRKARPSSLPLRRQAVEVARARELHGLERELGREPADHEREVVGRAGRGAERADLLGHEAQQRLRVEQRLRLLVEEGLVRRAAALGQEEQVVLVAGLGVDLDLRRQVRAGVLLAGTCRAARAASSAGCAADRCRRSPARGASASSPPVQTFSPLWPITIAVPVS